MDKKTTKEKAVKETAAKQPETKDQKKEGAATKEQPKDAPKDAPKEVPKEAPKTNEPPKDQKKDVKKDDKKDDTARKASAKKTVKLNINQKNQGFNRRGQKRDATKVQPEKKLYLKFGKKIINNKGEEQDLDEELFLRVPLIGVLFTGSWCPPAKEFMPQLEALYKEANAEEKVIEIIQISSEKCEADFKNNMTEERNWLYVPFNDPYMLKLKEEYKADIAVP